MCFVDMFMTIIKRTPNKKPKVIGMGASEPQDDFEYSRDGTSKDQNEAENIIPEAKLKDRVFSNLDSFLKKKINSAPTVVARHGKAKDNVTATE